MNKDSTLLECYEIWCGCWSAAHMKDGLKVIQLETAIYCSASPLTRCVRVCVCVSGYEFYYSSKIDSGPKAQASTHLQFQNGGEKRKNGEVGWDAVSRGGAGWIGCHGKKKKRQRKAQKNDDEEQKNESELIQSSSTLQAFASGFLFKRRGRRERERGGASEGRGWWVSAIPPRFFFFFAPSPPLAFIPSPLFSKL